jgi:hypothetical protein
MSTLQATGHWALDPMNGFPASTVEKRGYVVMKKSDAGCRTWLTSGKTWSYLRAHAARFTESEAAELAVGGAVAEKSA